MKTKTWLALLGLFLTSLLAARAAERAIDLAGNWQFAVDPIDRGETLGWARPDAAWKGDKPHPPSGWDTVVVPHDFLSDPRYDYTGVAWYRRSFAVPAATSEARAWTLQFEQVCQRCRVWLNGEVVGEHEGGFTPFAFDLGAQLKPGRQNFLVVAVDNRIKFRALPGARSGTTANAQLFPWLNYGGILGAVRLQSQPAVHVVRQQIIATPDAAKGTTAIVTQVTVRNMSREARPATVSVSIPDTSFAANAEVTFAAGAEQIVTLRGELPAATVKRWSLEAQPLYTAHAIVRSGATEDARDDSFGIRELVMRDGKFLLNGHPVRWAGANRARGNPVFGGRDPDEAVQKDMELMLAAGLRFARLQHTPPHANLLDWADRHGMLLILEVGVWGYTAPDLASPELRARYQAEMRELVALAANHPSVVAWSLGNEYESWLPEGIAWTRDMAAFVKTLDPSRPVTFPAVGTTLRKLREDGGAGEHAFDYVDFISTNLYFPTAETAAFLDPVHARWPGKPVFVSEFGLRADRAKGEAERIANFDAMLALVRARPWVCGLSFWAFNDYASRYPGTGADGYRRWGLVDEFRKPRALYDYVAQHVKNGLDATAQ